MNIHSYFAEKITTFLDTVYYKNLQKIYKKTENYVEELNIIFKKNKFPILNPEYFVYLKYYFVYLFFHYFSFSSYITKECTNTKETSILYYTAPLHFIYINDILFNNLLKKYNYVPSTNIYFLKDSINYIFYYLLNIKFFLLKKYVLLFLTNIFVFLVNINYIYKKRLLSIENKDFIVSKNKITDYLKIFIISPNKEFIKKVVHLTKYFTYSNYLVFINILIYIFI
jgi:hypothetical protein